MLNKNESQTNYKSEFGYCSYGKTLGESWIKAVECVIKNGLSEPDENRGRIALQNFRFKSESQILPDQIFDEYANKENIEAMIDLVFRSDIMRDFDVRPNFKVGAKSYKVRLQEGAMLDFVINRLSRIPESKKAVMVFPTYEDYVQVSKDHSDDYLPCIVSIQFRLRSIENGSYRLNTIFNMRSWNIDQKGAGDLVIMAMLNKKVADALSINLHTKVEPGTIDGLITDIHVYEETEKKAIEIITKYNELNPEIKESDQLIKQRTRWNKRALHWDNDIMSPEHYANFENGYKKFIDFEQKIISGMDTIDSAIDLGCGSGQALEPLIGKAKKLYALDFAEDMLKETAKKFPSVILLLSDVTSIPLLNESISIGVSRGVVISHLPEGMVNKFLDELSRIVKPNGKIIIDFLSNLDSVHFKNESPKILFTKDSISKQLIAHKFTNIVFDGEAGNRVIRVCAEKIG